MGREGLGEGHWSWGGQGRAVPRKGGWESPGKWKGVGVREWKGKGGGVVVEWLGAETLYHRDDALLYIAYVMLICAPPIPADRWHCSLWP